MMKFCKLFLVMLSVFLYSQLANSSVPITTDSRIKTFVFNENEVFRLTLHYGYQSNIEFAKNEEIETISVGNSYSWKITPVGRRLFIKPIEGDAHTNMTVITNRNTYQFELNSKYSDGNLDEELVYVVRFFYPSKDFDKPLPKKVNMQNFTPKEPQLPVQDNSFNFNYSIKGSENISPVKVFDDGKQTFLQFPNNNAEVPHIFAVDQSGTKNRSQYSRVGEYIVIKNIVGQLSLSLNDEEALVLNDNI